MNFSDNFNKMQVVANVLAIHNHLPSYWYNKKDDPVYMLWNIQAMSTGLSLLHWSLIILLDLRYGAADM